MKRLKGRKMNVEQRSQIVESAYDRKNKQNREGEIEEYIDSMV